MATKFSTGIAENPNSFKAGQEAAKQALEKMGKEHADIALVFASIEYPFDDVIKGIKSVIGNVPIVGCSSAGEFTNEKVTKGGVAVGLIQSDTHKFFSGIGQNVKEDQVKALEAASIPFPHLVQGHPYRSAMLFVDGLIGKGEETVLAASSVLGPTVKFSGGAASDVLKFDKTFVFGQGKALNDAVSVCFVASEKPMILSVKHGHHPVSKSLKVTKSKDNILYEIDGLPALEVWLDNLKDKLQNGKTVSDKSTKEDISKFLMQHEAGLMTGSNYKLRFPASVNPDGSLNFVCSIPEGSVFKIMDSNDADQIASARIAAENALAAAKGIKIAGAIVFDCACRSMLLKDKFPLAVEEIKKTLGDIPIIGFETYGEIAMDEGQFSGFHNTTTVIQLIPA